MAVYAAYMLAQSRNIPETVLLATSEAIQSLPASTCAISSEDGLVYGTLRIFNKAARFDIQSIVTGEPTNIHIIIDHYHNGYVWRDGSSDGGTGEYREVCERVGLASLSATACKAWWIPDGGAFIPPQGVSFASRL